MLELKTQFEKAAVDVLQLVQRPDDDTILMLYSLYKQAKTGDIYGNRPDLDDLNARAKYDAWAKLKGTTQDKAMEDYIKLVEHLWA
jgi:diazepam-binding inhibitor (GABA receptor modulator, acyl-CoA-binding protein)